MASHNPLDIDQLKALGRQFRRAPAVNRALAVQAASAKSGNRWLSAILRGMRGPGKLSVDEYFYYRLFEPSMPEDSPERFIGLRAQDKMHLACNDSTWFQLSNDKILFYTTLKGAGMPVPGTCAVVHATRQPALAPALNSRNDVIGFLSCRDNYPLFAKPSDGIYSLGSMKMVACDGTHIHLIDGAALEIGAVADFMLNYSDAGYVLQSSIANSASLRQLTGSTVATIRFLITLDGAHANAVSSVIKLPRDNLAADNYWQPGNMVGAIGENGTIERAVSGHGLSLQEHECHPDTKAALTGAVIEGYTQARDTVLAGAGVFPGIRTQSWDVALTDSGPVLLEMNFGGDLNLHQLAHARGMLTPDYVRHLQNCGYRGRLPRTG